MADRPDIDHVATVFDYEATVGVRPRSRRPIRRLVWSCSCSCGAFGLAGVDYIDLRRLWRKHLREAGAPRG